MNALIPFAATYLCESGFLALVNIKRKNRNRLDAQHDILGLFKKLLFKICTYLGHYIIIQYMRVTWTIFQIPNISKKSLDSELIKEESVVQESMCIHKFGFPIEDSNFGEFNNLSAILRLSIAVVRWLNRENITV